MTKRMVTRIIVSVIALGVLALVADRLYKRYLVWPGARVGTTTSVKDLGLWVHGDRVTTPVTDWSFLDKVRTVRVETSWHGIPYSVTVAILKVGQQPYVYSYYFPPRPGMPDLRDRFPEARFWNQNVARDPRVRIQIQNQVFERRLVHVTDPREQEACEQSLMAMSTLWAKDRELPQERRPRPHFLRIEPR